MSGAEATPSAAGRMPDFVVIGAMKAGTTTLWGHLASHPSIFMCRPKEPQFWSREAPFARGLDWYRSLFSAARDDQICGEASTCYSRWPHFGDVASRIAHHLPKAKLVYLLRHPVDRAFSHYTHLMDERAAREGGPIISFEAAIDAIPEIIDASLYEMQIRRFLAYYPRSSLHALTLDDLRENPEATWEALQDFLAVSRVRLDPKRHRAIENPAGDALAQAFTRRGLQHTGQMWFSRFALHLIPRAARNRMITRIQRPQLARRLHRRRLEAHRDRLSPLSAATRAYLLARFAVPTHDLEEFLGRRLPGWFE